MKGVGGVPAQRWAAAEAAGWTPALSHDAGEIRLLLGRSAVRTLQRAGIDHLSLRYQSRELDALRRALPAGAAVALKYDVRTHTSCTNPTLMSRRSPLVLHRISHTSCPDPADIATYPAPIPPATTRAIRGRHTWKRWIGWMGAR